MAELDNLLDDVLRGIGRNVLNLQKMEGMLKFIVSSMGSIGSTMDYAQPIESLQKSIKERAKTISRQPMGRLVERLSSSLNPGKNSRQEKVSGENHFSIELSFTIDDEEFLKQLDQALSDLVRERNELIHKKLLHFDPKSTESCQTLIKDLDEQRARIKPQFQALSAICTSLREHHKQLKDYTESKSFADDLKHVEEQHKDASTDS